MLTMAEVTVRGATSSDLSRLAHLAGGGAEEDWAGAEPYWIVAQVGDEIVGCLQAITSRPAGRIEELHVDGELDARSKAVVAYQLVHTALLGMEAMGLRAAVGMIAFDNKSFKRMIQKRFHGDIVQSGHLLGVRIG